MQQGKAFQVTPGFRKSFAEVKVGASAAEVLALLGEPTHKDDKAWTFAERRAPRPGEQLIIYVVEFAAGKVTRKSEIGGADAAGPPADWRAK